MKIAKVRADLYRVPVKAFGLPEPRVRAVVAVRVETDTGVPGMGISALNDGFALREFLNAELAPFVTGRDAMDTERLWDEVYWEFNQRSLSGVVSHGMSAFDMAVWDIKGKHLGQPVWRLLGGYSAAVPAYITFGLGDYDRDQLVAAARHFAAAGHDRLKMVVATKKGTQPGEDARRVEAVRAAIGDGIELMVDANHGFDFVSAADLCRRIEPLDIKWFEEPIRSNDVRQLAALRRRTSIPISAGQNEGFRFRHRDFMVAEAVDLVQPNVLSVGGYTEAIKVAHMAQAFNLRVANGGGWPHHNAHLIAAVPNGWRVEFHAQTWRVGEALFHDPPAPVKGSVTLTEKPGLGLEPRQDAMRDLLVK
jgi:L-alanine-DL-glutamate epimerase-like enolase superfamily enzyme